MKFHLISDNIDTIVGMRLAGITGVLVHEDEEVKKALTDAMAREDVAVILMTEKLVKLCPDLVYDLKLNRQRPLIVEIPDRHGNGRTKDSITKYVRDAIGVNLDPHSKGNGSDAERGRHGNFPRGNGRQKKAVSAAPADYPGGI